MKSREVSAAEDPRRAGLDRRRLLAGGCAAIGGFALSPRSSLPGTRIFLSLSDSKGAKESPPRTLVLLQLTGGNDGLSTVVPFADDVYNRSRSTTRIERKGALELDDYRGLHPGLKRLRSHYDGGRLAIVEGCGYPDPVRSHFQALEIWHTADPRGRTAGEGWIGKLCDAAFGGDDTAELVVHVGSSAPYSIHSTTHPAVAFTTPQGYKWVAIEDDDIEAYRKAGEKDAREKGEKGAESGVLDRLRGVLADAQESSLKVRRAAARYRPKAPYPADELSNSLRVAAALIDARIGSRVISVELGGFDSHNNQANQHGERMSRLDAALGAFLQDLHGTSAGNEVLVMVFSEFGRRVQENGAGGTDHGAAGPMFVAGTKVKGGLYGKHPSMTDLDEGDLVHTTDFRSVYATVIEKWFGADHAGVLGAKYPLLAFA